MKKIRLFAIIYIFFVFSLNCFGQESNKYVLIYEDFEKISEIQELIENSNTKILEKYGVSLKDLDFLENLEFQRFFIGYQVRIIDEIKLLEMKYDRSRIENFLIANNLSFSVIKRDMKAYIFLPDVSMPQLDEVEQGQLDSQLEMLKLISSLNHNINIEYEYPNRSEFEEILKTAAGEESLDFVLIVIQKENPDSWKINFPISKRVFKNESLDFHDFLIDEIISISTKSREIIRNKFILEIPFRDSDMVENLLGFLASRNEVISFSFKSLNSKYIELEYETYLSKTEAEKMLSEFRWQE
ncbi:MAG: hypothetical protein CMQ68_04740 [Gammaproteobacteria bacterium]|nr:hypothetical protein [Gammaproteobacteria bacterium]